MARKRRAHGCAEVERACLKRATGYEVTETKREYKVNEQGELELTRATEQVKHVPGDLRAVEFWLTNREPALWSKSPGEREEREETGGVVVLAQVEREGSGGSRDGASAPENSQQSGEFAQGGVRPPEQHE